MGGKSKSSDPVKYYIQAEEQVICSAPIDEILSIRVNDSIAYKGFADNNGVVNTNSLENGRVYKLNNSKSIKFDLTSLFGGNDSEGGIKGWCDFRFGQDNQEKSRALYRRVGNVVLGATRGIVTMVMKNFYTGISPYAKAWHFRVKSTQKKDNYQTNWYVEKASIYHQDMSQKITVNNHIVSDQYTRYSLCNAKEKPTALKGFVINDSSGYKGQLPNQSGLTINYYDINLNNTGNSFSFKNNARYTQTVQQGYQPTKTSLPASYYVMNVAKVLETNSYIDRNGHIGTYNEIVANNSPNVTNPQIQIVKFDKVSYDAFSKAMIYVLSTNDTIYNNTGSTSIGMRLPYKSKVTNTPTYGAPTITEVDNYQPRSERLFTTSPNNVCVCASGDSVYYVDNSWNIFYIKRHYYLSSENINISHLLNNARKVLAINVDDTSEYITIVYAKRSSYDTGNDVLMAYGNRSVLINEINLSSLYGIRYNFHSTNNGASATGVDGDYYNAYFVNIKGGTAFVYDNHYFNLTMPSVIMLNNTQIDYNPVHAIYEIITNKVWGLGKDPSCIDETNFKAVADTLFNEKLGISFTYETSEKISELLQKILNIIGGVLRLNRTTGLLELKLIRGDYTKSSLPIFDYSNIDEISEVSRTALSECINQVTLKYTDWQTGDSASYVIQDLGLLQQTGEVNNSDIEYKYIHWADTAQMVALRELCDVSSQFLGCEITANSDGRNVNLGDCIVVNFPKFKISNTVFRVNKISYGSSSDLRVKMTLIQDKYDYPTTEAYEPPRSDTNSGSPVIQESTTIIRYWDIMETPYYMLYKKYGLATIEEHILINPFISKISPLVSKYKATGVEEIKKMYSVDDGRTFIEADGSIEASLSCITTNEIDLTTTTISYSDGYGMSKVNNTYFAIINNEIMIVANNETLTDTITVGRGCLDTVPQKHPAGSVIFFVKRDDVPVMNEEFINQDVSVRCYGAYGSSLDLAQDGEKSISLDVRALKPYNIANVKINDISFGTNYTSVDYRIGNSLKITFNTRNRTYQIGDEILDWFNNENISLEDNCAIKLDWVVDNKTVHTDTLLNDTNYVHVPQEVDGDKVTLRFYTEIDDNQCYQPFEQEINIKQDANFAKLQVLDGELISYTDSNAQFNFMLEGGELKYTINSTLDSKLRFEKQDDDIVKIIDIIGE